jgi:hypothetical protein
VRRVRSRGTSAGGGGRARAVRVGASAGCASRSSTTTSPGAHPAEQPVGRHARDARRVRRVARGFERPSAVARPSCHPARRRPGGAGAATAAGSQDERPAAASQR